jgi:hypothetical protein
MMPERGGVACGAEPARLKHVRVRQFELRLLAVALTVLWTATGGLVVVAYRPGGPVDLLVGIAASLPIVVSVAPIVWPPLVRSDRGSAGVFWLGLLAGLLLLPSLAGVIGQVLQGGAEPLLPSLEAMYPWGLALLATSLFAGLGISRRLIPEVGIGKRRLAASIVFTLAATSIISGVFAGVSLADNAALRDRPAPYSKFGPTAAHLVLPDCNRDLTAARTARLELDLWADVDTKAVGTVSLTGSRSGSDSSWTAQVVRSDLFGQYGGVRIGSSAWSLAPGSGWVATATNSLDDRVLDLTVGSAALSLENRATAENRGLEYVDGARARHCRVAVDGPTFAASFPQIQWLAGETTLSTWRGELNFWVFGDDEVGMISGSVNGPAVGILPRGLQATIEVRMTATDRDYQVTISPPHS